MGSNFGRFFQVSTFGESHGAGVGVVIDGVPAGLALDQAEIQRQLDRRRPGRSPFTSPRQELDQVEILSGVFQGRTIGSPVALLVRNKDARSHDYDSIRTLFRPGHADYPYFKKYGVPPLPGGGRSSGRETIGRVAAGAVAGMLLGPEVQIRSATAAVGSLQAEQIDFDFAEDHPLRFGDPDRAERAEQAVREAMADGDSIGGVVLVRVEGVPVGLGDPVFWKLDAVLALGALSIGGVKGIEFGDGFALAGMRGSESNDRMTANGFLSNHAGGVLGGLSTGQPMVMRLAVKPTSSISKPQATIDLNGEEAVISVHGRHDPCLCPRIGPVAEAMTAIVLADALLEQQARPRIIS